MDGLPSIFMELYDLEERIMERAIKSVETIKSWNSAVLSSIDADAEPFTVYRTQKPR